MSEPQEVSLAELVPDSMNANLGTERGRKVLRQSLEKLGAGRSILLDRHNRIIAGNKATEQALAAGLTTALLVETDGSQLVAVRRNDLDLDEPQAREMALFDNRASELDLSWSPDAIAAQLDLGLDLSALWTGDELEELLRGLEEPPGLAPGADADAIPEEVETRCKPGEVWEAGRHRLLCGDSTDAASVARLLDGKGLRLVWTDPPYGVSYADKNAFLNAMDRGNHIQTPIENDHMSEAATETLCREALALAVEHGLAGAACYLACPCRFLPLFLRAYMASGFDYRHCLVWVKNQFILGRSDYHYRHEPILYGWKEGAHYFVDDHSQDSVFEVDKPRQSDLHPTMKPVELVERMVKNSSRAGDLVYDPFLGSGTTLIACEATGRTCFGCEVDANYASVCLARYEAVTGDTARRLEP